MNVYWIEVLSDGEIYSCGTFPDGITPTPLKNGTMLQVATRFDPQQHYFDFEADSPVSYPERPDQNHTFNFHSRKWEDSRTVEKVMGHIRAVRDRLLSETDWVLLRAQDTSTPVPEEWRTYRQTLRDITKQPDPFNIQWPVMPGSN